MATYSTPRFFATMAAPAFGALAAAGVWGSTVLDRLPEDTATHFRSNGTPDGFMSPAGAVFVPLAIGCVATAALMSMFLSPATRQGGQARWLAGTASGLGVFLALLTVLVTTANLDLTSGVDARLGFGAIASALIPSLVIGVVVGMVITPAPAPRGAEGRPAGARGDFGRSFTLPDGATASWFGYAPPGAVVWLIASGTMLFILVIAAITQDWRPLMLACVTVILVCATSYFKVSISPRGVQASSLVGFPRISIPLEDIEDAEVSNVHFGTWGGWGWRWGPRGTGLITRGTEALRVNRTDGKILEITCNEPATAAGVVNALKRR